MDTMLMTLLERLAWTSLQTVLLVALVLAACRWLPRLSAATRCRLWWLVSLQAVLGLAWAQPLQVPLLPAASTQLAAAPLNVEALADAAASLQTTGALPASVAESNALLASSTGTAWWVFALASLWLAGMLVMAWRTFGQWQRSRALLASATPCQDETLVAAVQLAAQAHGLRRAPQVCSSATIDAPQLVGPLRPVLLLPDGRNALQGDALDLALTHELQHLQRGDLRWGLLPALAQHLFFFHPLLRLAVREYAQAREEAVDAAVVAGHGECRHGYGQLLLQLGVQPRPHLGVASAAVSQVSLKRRLRSLQPGRPSSRAVTVAVTALVLAVGVLPMRLVAALPPPPPPPPAVAALPVPPAPPAAPPAPSANAVPRVPRVPVVPTVPPVPKVPAMTVPPVPAAPAAPSATRGVVGAIVTEGRLDIGTSPSNAYVLLGGERSFVDASVEDVHEARRVLGARTPALWVRQGEQRYVVRDPALIQQFHTAYDGVGALGREQVALGERQAALGAETSRHATRLAERATEEAMRAIGRTDVNREAAAEAARAGSAAATRMETAKLQAQIQALAKQQAALGNEQAKLSTRQMDAQRTASARVQALIAQAMADGRAQRL